MARALPAFSPAVQVRVRGAEQIDAYVIFGYPWVNQENE
jgi:hypothetical protein